MQQAAEGFRNEKGLVPFVADSLDDAGGVGGASRGHLLQVVVRHPRQQSFGQACLCLRPHHKLPCSRRDPDPPKPQFEAACRVISGDSRFHMF